MDFVDEIDFLIFAGIVEGDALLTLCSLLKSHQVGLTDAKEMQREIDSFKSEFYLRMMQNQTYEH